jgi:O-antigen/teichoic acid export membrane protein
MQKSQEKQAIVTELGTALRHTIVYGMGNMLAKAIGFLMLPFYTHYLSPSDYGVLELLDLSMSLFGMFLTMGMTAAVLRCYAAATSKEGRNRVISTAFLFALVTGAATFSLGFGLFHPASRLIFGPGIPARYLLISFSSLICTYITLVPRTYLRALEASGTFTVVDNTGLAVMLGLNIYFIAVAKIGLVGILLSSLIVGAIQLLSLSIWAVRRVGLHFDSATLWRALRFGAPLMFSNLGLFVLNFSDRFFLKHFTNLTTVGIYAVGYKFGYMMNFLVVQPFFVMWQARMYRVHEQPNHAQIFDQIFRLYAFLLVLMGLGISMFSPEIVHTMVRSTFFAGQSVIPIVVLAYVCWGLGFYGQTGMFLTNNTHLIGILGAAAAIVNLALNFALIKQYGMMGAAWATLLSFAILAIGSFALSHRMLALKVGRVAAAIGLGIAVYELSVRYAPASAEMSLLLKVTLLLAFPILLHKLRILTADDREMIAAFWERSLTGVSRITGNFLKKETDSAAIGVASVSDAGRD